MQYTFFADTVAAKHRSTKDIVRIRTVKILNKSRFRAPPSGTSFTLYALQTIAAHSINPDKTNRHS